MTVVSACAVAALLMVLAVGIIVSVRLRTVRTSIARQHSGIAALRARLAERGRVAAVRDRLESAQRTAEEVVDVGNESVRNTHDAIADIPFTILGQITATRRASRAVREVHDATANGVYDAIGFVNRLTGDRLRDGLHRGERRGDRDVGGKDGADDPQ